MIRILTRLFGGFLALVLSASLAAEENLVRVGVLAKRGTEYTLARWGATADYLTERLPGHRFRIVPLRFDALIPAVRDAEVEFVLTNSAMYVDLEVQFRAERIATLKNLVADSIYTAFGGVVLAAAGRADLHDLKDLRGQRVAAVHPDSLGGFLSQARELLAAGVDPRRSAGELVFLGTHDAVMRAVVAGRVDVGLVRTDILEHMAAEGALDPKTVQVVAPRRNPDFPLASSTRLYPEWPIARLAHTSADLAERVAVVLLGMRPDDTAARIGHYGGWATPGNYRAVHELLESLQAGPYEGLSRRNLVRELRRRWPWLAGGLLGVTLLLGVILYIGRLNRSLKHSRGVAEAAREQLEDRVRERTAALETALSELRESHQRLQRADQDWNNAFDTIRSLIFLHDRDFRIMRANRAYRERAGLPESRILGRVYWEVFPPVESDHESCALAADCGHPSEHEVCLDNGEVFLCRHFVARDSDGEYRYSVHVLEDITAQHRAQQAVKQSEQHYRLLLDGANDAVFVHGVSPDGMPTRFTEVNMEACRRLGYQRSELLAMGPKDIDASDQATIIQEQIGGLRRERHTVFESVHLARDGRRIPVEISAHLFDLDGIATVLSLARDISERKQAEQALHRSRAGLEEAQRIAHLGNWQWEIATGTLEWSREIYHIFGHEPVDGPVSYEDFLRYVHPDDRGRVEQAVADALAGHADYGLDHRIRHADGGERVVHEKGEVVLDRTGKPLRMIGTVQDVTEARKHEAELLRLNRALRTTSLCNQALVRTGEEQALLDEICRILVDSGDYPLAWVGFAQKDEQKLVRPVAQAARRPGYPEQANINWDADSPRGRGPTGKAIRSGRPSFVDDVKTDPDFAPWREQALQWGYASTAALPLAVRGQVIGTLTICASHADPFDAPELALLNEMAEDLAFGIGVLRERERHGMAQQALHDSELRLRSSLEQTIEAVALTIETRDPYTAGHQKRVTEIALSIARALGMDDEALLGLRLGAMIHDIGKLYVPAEFLTRPGRLSRAEFEIIQSHAQVGYDIIRGVAFPWPVADIVHQHHERLDGSGYPRGLKGKEIILEARILAVADVLEAMASHRPYRPALPIDKAVAELREQSAKRYDTRVVDACLDLLQAGRLDLGNPERAQ